MGGIVGFIGMCCLYYGAYLLSEHRKADGFIAIVIGLMLLSFAGGMLGY